jgi:MFS family permease
MSDSNQKSAKPAMAAVGCTVIICLNLGASSLFSVMLPSFVKNLQSSVTEVALAATFGTLSGFVFSLLGSKIISALSPKWTLIIGTAAIGGHLIIYSVAGSLPLVYLASTLSGAGIALGMHASVAGVIAGWFKTRMQSVIGVIFGISSFGSAAMIAVAGQMLKIMDYQSALRILGLVIVIGGIVVNLLLVHKPDMSQASAGTSRSGTAPGTAAEPGLLMKEAVKTPAFIFFFLAMVLAATLFAGFNLFATSFWQSEGMEPATSASFVSLMTVFAALVAMAAGFVVEKFGSRVLMFFVFGGYILGMVLTCLWPGIKSGWFTVLCVLMIAFVRPVNSIPSLVLPDLFGKKDYNSINSLGMAGYYLGAAISSVLVGAIRDLTNNFIMSFIVLAVFAGFALLLFLVSLRLSPLKRRSVQ